ncbi:MAG: metal-dependent transcriptional regulator [Chloroflexi bacterium]|nr:metal-dependent transcriptional regulator [Chloroflexota bacterium]
MVSSPAKRATPVIEDYLQTIYSLNAEGEAVFGVRLARAFKVSPPTVTAALRRMAREGYIRVTPKKEVHLTSKGKSLAEAVVRRHRLAERMLRDLLGLDWVDIHEEAHRFEHVISPRIEERLKVLLHSPQTCPHGSPIPGLASDSTRRGTPLSRVPAGRTVTVERITEQAEIDRGLMTYFAQHGILPGALLHMVEVSPSAGTVTIASQDKLTSMAFQAAEKVLVRPVA